MSAVSYRVKCRILPALGFLMVCGVQAQTLVIPPEHWQEGMTVGVTDFSGTLYVRDVPWQWQPQSVILSDRDAVQAGLTSGRTGMETRSPQGQAYYILGGHTTSLTAARPGLQPSVTLLQTGQDSPRIAARGELDKGQVRYGEITFSVRHVLAWQDRDSAERGWSVVSGDVTPDMEQQVKRQLWQVSGYDWEPVFSGTMALPGVFTSGATDLNWSDVSRKNVAGAWVTALSDIQVNFPGAEEPVKKWQGNLTPVVVYL